jgi:hypothetical protein
MKRSSQVALLLMGVTTAGASSYALIPPRDCVAPDRPAAIGAINPQTLAPGAIGTSAGAAPCNSNARSSSYGGGRSSYWSSRSSGNTSSTTQLSGRRSLFSSSTSRTSVPTVGRASGTIGSRGGFGSTGHSAGHSSSS